MGTKYATEAISGYNSTPPADDGSVSSANQIKWSTIKTKLDDPLKTAIENIDTKLVNAANLGPNSQTTTYAVVAADHLKTIACSGTFTVTLGACATLAAGFTVTIKNESTGVITIARSGSDTIDAGTTDSIATYASKTYQVNASANGWHILSNVPADAFSPIPVSATWISSTSFKVSGDQTASFDLYRAVKKVGSVSGTDYSYVNSVSYSAPWTTVSLYGAILNGTTETVTVYPSLLPGTRLSTASADALPYILANVYSGAGSPEGVLTASIGTLYVNLSGGASTTLYVKTSGAGNTGWTAK